MNNEPSFKMSQDYEILPPQKKRAYPILVEEWEHIKTRIRNIQDNVSFFHTTGSVLLGVAGSAIIAALTLNLPATAEGTVAFPILVSWSIFFLCLICGILSLYFASKQREIQRTTASDVIQQMSLIEQRYEVEKN